MTSIPAYRLLATHRAISEPTKLHPQSPVLEWPDLAHRHRFAALVLRLADRLHAHGDATASRHGLTITRHGLTGRTYRDARFDLRSGI